MPDDATFAAEDAAAAMIGSTIARMGLRVRRLFLDAGIFHNEFVLYLSLTRLAFDTAAATAAFAFTFVVADEVRVDTVIVVAVLVVPPGSLSL